MQTKKVVKPDCTSEERLNETVLANLYPGLLKYCQFLSQNKWDGEDLAHQVILKTIQHYKMNQNINGQLLNKIAYNSWIDHIRKRKREVIFDSLDSLRNEEAEPDADISETIDYFLKQLTPKQALIYTLKSAFLYRSNEIATIMGISEVAVKSLLHRAKERLARLQQGEEIPSIHLVSDREDAEQLFELLSKALGEENPSILVESITRLRAEQKSTVVSRIPFSSSSPLTMAA